MANVYESNISYRQNGRQREYYYTVLPGKIFHGRIDKVMNVLDPSNKVMKLENHTEPIPGLFTETRNVRQRGCEHNRK